MYEIVIQPIAMEQLRKIRKAYQVQIFDALRRCLSHEPERESKSRIKRLRGRQKARYRLRVAEYRVFYDVVGDQVLVLQVMHKSATEKFYTGGEA